MVVAELQEAPPKEKITKVTLKKLELLAALKRVRNTVATTKTVQIYQCLCFRNGTVTGYNGTAGTSTATDLGLLDFAIPCDRLLKVVEVLFDEITFDLKDSKLCISSGGNRTTLETLPTKGYPEILPSDSEKYCDAENLVKCLQDVSFTVGTNPLKPEIFGVAIKGEYVYSCDKARITRAKLTKAANGYANLPPAAVGHIAGLGKIDYMFKNEGLIGVLCSENKSLYVSHLLSGKFPIDDVNKLFGMQKQNPAEFPADLAGAVSRVRLLGPTEETVVTIENTGGGLLVQAGSEIGNAMDLVQWDYDRPFKFAVRPDYIEAALARTRKIDLTDILEGSKRGLLFMDDGFDHMMGLFKVRE